MDIFSFVCSCFISVAEAEGGGSPGKDSGSGSGSGNSRDRSESNPRDRSEYSNYRDRSEPSSINNRRRSLSPLSSRPLPRSIPLGYQPSRTEPRVQIPYFGQAREPSSRYQLPPLRNTVQTIPPMGLPAPQKIAIVEGPEILRRAMAGLEGYLPAYNLFDSDVNNHAYNRAED